MMHYFSKKKSGAYQISRKKKGVIFPLQKENKNVFFDGYIGQLCWFSHTRQINFLNFSMASRDVEYFCFGSPL